MNPASGARRPSRVVAELFAVGCVAAILYVPYFVPQAPTVSDAYVFGFNNRVAVALLVVFCAWGAFWTKGYGLKLLPAGEPAKIPRKVLAVCLAIQLAACVAMVALVGRAGGFAESHYDIDRIWLLAQGKTPYVGFEWPFGALLLYGPLWISHLLHCGIDGGYSVFWILASVGGVAILYAVVDRLDYPTARKTSISLLLFVAFLPSVLDMGVHYTLLRFATPFYCVLVVYGMAKQPGRRWPAAALAAGFAAMLLTISPEMAVAHCFACCVLLFPRKITTGTATLPGLAYAAMLAAFAGVFALAGKLHVLDTLIASGGGADSFPIPPSFPVLFFFAAVFVCACALVRRWVEAGVNDNSVCLIVVAVPLLAAALGRCDPGHLLCNGLGFLLAAFLYASGNARAWRIYRNSFLIAAIAIPGCVDIGLLAPEIGRVAVQAAARSAEPEAIDFAQVYSGVDLSRSDGRFEAPFGYTPNGTGSYHSSAVDYGYYEGIENANTPRAVERKIGELAAHPERDLLLAGDAEGRCRVDERLQQRLMTALFFFPYIAHAVHPVSVRKPLCDYITSHYAVMRAAGAEGFGYALWAPKGTKGGP